MKKSTRIQPEELNQNVEKRITCQRVWERDSGRCRGGCEHGTVALLATREYIAKQCTQTGKHSKRELHSLAWMRSKGRKQPSVRSFQRPDVRIAAGQRGLSRVAPCLERYILLFVGQRPAEGGWIAQHAGRGATTQHLWNSATYVVLNRRVCCKAVECQKGMYPNSAIFPRCRYAPSKGIQAGEYGNTQVRHFAFVL